ncbi:hypothetical protein K466DRAFT_599655 [Polyporus arcularius HHB13444]|uniref:F-box domain-containing protein n=1 Tax=Polyporus arcularius HHB13444 TaxID=1314778 RepID=A0A5C3PD64_9APHY|nr:hypothetical protein K466DRAFT_599655 [Polyporus arcularius HHB13444]
MSVSPEKAPLNELITLLTSHDDIARRINHFALSGCRDVSFANLEALLKPLTSLRTLDLTNVSISRPLSSEPEVVTGPVVPALATLSIKDYNVIEQGVDIFFRLLSLFGEIDDLHLSARQPSSTRRGTRNLDDLESRIGLILHSPAQITNLTMGSLPLHFFAQLCHPWSRPFWASVRSISVEDGLTSWAEIKQLGKVFAAHPTQFHRIVLKASHKLVVPPDTSLGGASGYHRIAFLLGLAANPFLPSVPNHIKDMKKQWKLLRLRQCEALDGLTVTLDHSDEEIHDHGWEVFSITVDLLAHLPSCVRQVRITMVPNFNTAQLVGIGSTQPPTILLEVLNWQALDKVLSVPRFKRVKIVLEIVRLKNTHFARQRYWQVLDNIRDRLPLLSSRNMLAFSVCDRS